MTDGSGIDDAATWEQAEMAAVLVAAGAVAAGGDWVWDLLHADARIGWNGGGFRLN